MAYAALVSLVQSLDQLLHSDHPQFPLQDHPKSQINSLHDKLHFLQSSLDKIFPVPKSIRKNFNDLEIQIRDEMYKAQDTIEYFLSRQTITISESEENIPRTSQMAQSLNNFLQDLQRIIAEIDPITKRAVEIKDSIKGRKEDQQTSDPFSSMSALSTESTSSRKSKIVGQENALKEVMCQLTSEASKELQVIPIIGMAGIGKTTLARSIYKDPLTEGRFVTRAWVTVSQEFRVRDIYLQLLSSIESKGQKSDVPGSTNKLDDKLSQKNESELALDLHHKLFDTRYLIVIDDMWEISVWNKVRQCFQDNKKGSRILLTTRLEKVANYAKSSDFGHQMSLLDEENSLKLLCQNVFGEGRCPPQLEPFGKKIANNCGGLPLSLTVVGGLLFKEEKTKDYWEMVAEDTRAAAAGGAQDKSYKEILSLSYNHLPGKLKGCFLYMGAFPEDSDILVSKLIQLWVAEGFLTPQSPPYQNLEQVAEHYLKDLVERNLIYARKTNSRGQIKTCWMHDTLRDLAMKESEKEQYFHSIYRNDLKILEGKESQRRLSVHKSILMCMEDIYDATKSIKHARTLLYVGQHHHHPLPYCLTFELLRVLDAITVHFIAFPTEIVELIHLRYLSLSYNGKFPKSLSNLRYLQVLIVRRHPKIILTDTSFLPVEIWNMPQLRHILFTESCLPDLSGLVTDLKSPLLENLQTLSNVNAVCLTKEVLENIPNLKKLGIWIEASGSLDFCLDEVLDKLEALKFTVLNPIPGSKIEFHPKLAFPESLRKLSLSGCGIPWEDITVIGQLPHLEVLKLRHFAFQGETWCLDDMEFDELKYLLLEFMDLRNWEVEESPFRSLERLVIRHCYELQGIPSEMGNSGCLQLIELVDCSRYASDSAQKIMEEQKDLKKDFQVRIYSSWE